MTKPDFKTPLHWNEIFVRWFDMGDGSSELMNHVENLMAGQQMYNKAQGEPGMRVERVRLVPSDQVSPVVVYQMRIQGRSGTWLRWFDYPTAELREQFMPRPGIPYETRELYSGPVLLGGSPAAAHPGVRAAAAGAPCSDILPS